jgi:hypothetical protein
MFYSYEPMPQSSNAEIDAARRASLTKTRQVYEALTRGNRKEIRAAIETDLRTKGFLGDYNFSLIPKIILTILFLSFVT